MLLSKPLACYPKNPSSQMRVYDNKELRPVSYYGIIIVGVNTCVNFYSVVTESAATE